MKSQPYVPQPSPSSVSALLPTYFCDVAVAVTEALAIDTSLKTLAVA